MKHGERLIGICGMFLAIFALTGCSQAAAGDLLNGTTWTLTGLAGSSPVEGTTITMQFSDGQVGGSAGCNSYGGVYEAKGGKLETAELVSTLMACTDTGVMEQEQVFLAHVQDAESYEINGEQLKIITAEGAELLFVPAE